MDLPLTSLVAPREGRPIALFLACHTGAIDDPRTSLAENLLLREKGSGQFRSIALGKLHTTRFPGILN
ncbi:MAG: hypothetical protein ACKO81_02800, partial [Planctomycetota bacterium]